MWSPAGGHKARLRRKAARGWLTLRSPAGTRPAPTSRLKLGSRYSSLSEQYWGWGCVSHGALHGSATVLILRPRPGVARRNCNQTRLSGWALSFPRKRESNAESIAGAWIPAFAGMTISLTRDGAGKMLAKKTRIYDLAIERERQAWTPAPRHFDAAPPSPRLEDDEFRRPAPGKGRCNATVN